MAHNTTFGKKTCVHASQRVKLSYLKAYARARVFMMVLIKKFIYPTVMCHES